MKKRTFDLRVDGAAHRIEADPDMPLLYALRNDLGKKGPKFGCGLAQCGACTVIVDGRAVRSCVTPVSAVEGEVRTLDGLGTPERPHPVQAAWIEAEAGQCEYCISGWVMTAVAFLEEKPDRSEDEIRNLLGGLKCRCGTHVSILDAITAAARAMTAERTQP